MDKIMSGLPILNTIYSTLKEDNNSVKIHPQTLMIVTRTECELIQGCKIFNPAPYHILYSLRKLHDRYINADIIFDHGIRWKRLMNDRP